jgi:hypothetical protein
MMNDVVAGGDRPLITLHLMMMCVCVALGDHGLICLALPRCYPYIHLSVPRRRHRHASCSGVAALCDTMVSVSRHTHPKNVNVQRRDRGQPACIKKWAPQFQPNLLFMIITIIVSQFPAKFVNNYKQ